MYGNIDPTSIGYELDSLLKLKNEFSVDDNKKKKSKTSYNIHHLNLFLLCYFFGHEHHPNFSRYEHTRRNTSECEWAHC